MATSKGSKKIGIQPLGDRVLVRPDSADDAKSPGGIYIPDTARTEKPERGTVVAVGPGKRGDDNDIIPVGVKVGDKVMFSKYGFDEVKIEDQEYYIISESSILAVFN
ncbi:co-chaperone GroES [bacterium]|nr:co-chaperone GroES [bacterium]